MLAPLHQWSTVRGHFKFFSATFSTLLPPNKHKHHECNEVPVKDNGQNVAHCFVANGHGEIAAKSLWFQDVKRAKQKFVFTPTEVFVGMVEELVRYDTKRKKQHKECVNRLPQVSHTVDLLELPVERLTLGCPGVPSPAGIYPQHSIRLRDAWYRYPNTEEWVLKGVNLTIPLGSRIALVGSTGSGKTTTAHLLLALLQPELGSFELDGNPLTAEEVPAWQANCAQVPQFIQLLDASVRDNVAFGIDNKRIDDDRVWEALEAAQLEEYVADLPFGLLTQVGENGHQLSGGQRQRLALARAFYRNSGFLVLDEATSSLDNRTENEVINALEVVGRRCTTVVIAHRLSTIARCDRIYEFEKGVVKASGSFDELRQRSASFQELASLERFSSIN